MDNTTQLDKLRHSTAHLLAAAVLRLWPDTKLTIGPSIENGFYYDFAFTNPINDSDLAKIEKKMADTLSEWTAFTKREVTKEEAYALYKDNPYKRELIDEIVARGEAITLYTSGRFEDLCRGGHCQHPNQEIKAFKLLSLAGAYWRGSEKNTMLTRIYGTSFPTQAELDDYLMMLEEAKKRDHKKLGRELELFFFDETSPGMAYWLPKGLTLYNTLYAFARETYAKYGYQEVATPQINKKELYETSGHWSHYRDDMFLSPMSYLRGAASSPLEGSEVFGTKPMNCPNAMRIFGYKTRSHHDLPLRFAETSMLHRFELSGTLNGLFRSRSFRQDDAHIFMTLDQVKQEFQNLMQMIKDMYAPFNLVYKLRFGTRPEAFMGSASDWDMAETMLKDVLIESGHTFIEAQGEGAFYGPKVDILMRDSLNREWQTGTIQLDFQQPKNFKLEYIESDGKAKTPVVFHRALFGSFERFLGILTEHYAGAFPLWLAPVQVTLLPIADRHQEYAQQLANSLIDHGIRAEVDTRAETLQAKIREATLQKVPFMGIIGDKEIASTAISVRLRSGEDQGTIEFSQFLKQVKDALDKKK